MSSKSESTTSLVPMSSAAFPQWAEHSAKNYAKDKVASKQWAAEGALERARAQIQQLLPEGIETPGHSICHLVADEETVGYLWWLERELPTGSGGYIFDIEIEVAHRRQGHARRALASLADDLRQRGLHRLGLHVFAQNTGAIRLYESLGYETTSLRVCSTRKQNFE